MACARETFSSVARIAGSPLERVDRPKSALETGAQKFAHWALAKYHIHASRPAMLSGGLLYGKT